jgi:hypothetical protein
LSQKLSRIIGVNKAREVSLTATPLTAEVAEKLGFVNHLVEDGELMKKTREIAEAIVKNNKDMVLRYKSVINDGIKLDLGHALSLEKVSAAAFVCQNYIIWIQFLSKLCLYGCSHKAIHHSCHFVNLIIVNYGQIDFDLT